uniref:DUF4220 domain-containing protein n=1 Tax=Oryza barthii TaxID=65489 RepID=A0A0D3GLW7_9ORYZ
METYKYYYPNSARLDCFDEIVAQDIKEYMAWRVRRESALLVVNAMLMGVMVGIGAYAPRYRHHPLTRFIFQGATALFMPIVSYVVSVTNWAYVITNAKIFVVVVCTENFRMSTILQWITFVQIVAISTTVVVATNARELGRSIAPSAVLLADAIWTCYLVINTVGTYFGHERKFTLKAIQAYLAVQPELWLLVSAIGIIFIKLGCKFCAFFMARKSFALGRNPELMVKYMCHLHAETRTGLDEHVPLPPPPLLVMGEDTANVQKGPHGYNFRYCMPSQSRHSDDESTTRELISLDKSTHVLSNNSDNNLPEGGLVVLDKVWHQIGERANDFTSPPQHLKDICLSFALFKLLRCRFARYTADEVKFVKLENFFWKGLLHTSTTDDNGAIRLLKCSCKLVDKAWKDKMNLCSVLQPIHIPRNASICHRLIRRFIPLPEKKISVNVPGAVKSAIISKLSSSQGRLSNGTASLQTVDALQVIKDSLLMACSGEGTADVLLAWHIATTIVEVRHSSDTDSRNSNRVVATHLSGYCAYLVAYCPELLPDDEAWTNDLYKAVTGDAWCALAAGDAPELPEDEYTKLVELLGKNCKHEVVKNGTRLAAQLVDPELGEEKAWEVLAGFWSEMILYVAPSDNLDAHAAAVARGGELITQLWALLTHAGIITRPSTATAAAADNENASANGTTLAAQLVHPELGEEKAWEVLAGFWSEIILYVTPSDNLDGHAAAVACGGELITQLWVLLTHAGIITRPSTATATAATADNENASAV